MADYTRDAYMAALRNAHAAGDTAAAERLAAKIFALQETEKPSPLSDTTPGFIDRLSGNYSAAVQSGLTGMEEGAERVISPDSSLLDRAKGAGQAVLGAAGYVSSPLTAATKTIVTDPVIAGERSLGMPEGYSNFMGNLAGGAADLVSGAGISKAAPLAARGLTAVGDAAAPVARELAATPSALMNRVKPTPAPLSGELATPPAGLITPSVEASKAENILYQKMTDAGWTPARIEAKLKQLGPGATMADLEPFLGSAEAAAQFPKGARTAARALGNRDAGTQTRLLTTVDNTLSPEQYYESLDALKKDRSVKAQPLRQDAMASAAGKPIKSDMIQRLQKDSPYFNSAMAEGKKIAKEEAAREGIEIPTSETWYYGDSLNDPNLTLKHEPTLHMLDAAKQGYQAMLKPYRNPYTGVIDNADPTAVELSKTVQALTKEMRTYSPKYSKYLDSWSEDSQQLDALARGRKVLENDPEVTLKSINKASPEEKEFLRIGMARALKDKLNNNPQAALRYFDRSSTQSKMQAVFPSKYDWNLFKRQTLREAQKRSTYNAVKSNSKSVQRAMGVADIQGEASSLPAEAMGAAFDVATKNPIGLARRAGRFAMNKMSGKPAQPVADELASVLYSSDPVLQERMIQRFKARSMPQGPREAPVDELDEALP